MAASTFIAFLRLKLDARSGLAVHEGSEQLAVPILHVPRLVQPSLEQRLKSLLCFRPRQRRCTRWEAVEEAVGGRQRDVVDEILRGRDRTPIKAGDSARKCIH